MTATTAQIEACIVPDERGGFRVHRVGCRDIPSGEGHWRVTAYGRAELVTQAEEAINCDFAGDYGQTVAEYLAEGNGYTVDGGDVRILPCCAHLAPEGT